MADAVAITIGNFDGVHLGHVQLVHRARALAGPRGRVLVLAFDPQPATVLRPESTPKRLSNWEQRSAWLHEAGADEVVPLRPTPEFLSKSAQQFVVEIVQRYQPTAIVEGPDFRFGRGRAGSVQTLRDLQSEGGFQMHVIDPVEAPLLDQSPVLVSSSMIRWLLLRGRVDDASRLLSRPFEINGPVMQGDRRGRELGIPTINVECGDFVLPADGVYAGIAVLPDSRQFAAAISVGIKPTFGINARACEAHLIGYDGPLDHYGWPVRLQFHAWVRDQLTFAGKDSLIEQMHRDIEHIEQAVGLLGLHA